MNQQEQVNELNSIVRAKLAPSKIHGIGVFAIRNIYKGEKCYLTPPTRPKFYTIPYGSINKLFPEVKELILERWPSLINGSHILCPNDMVFLITYLNHADDYNYDVGTDKALKNIKKGEEITQNYRRMVNYEKIYKWLI